jgi:hypothetical protein
MVASQPPIPFDQPCLVALKVLSSQGERKEAYDLLEPVYGGFTEGFDTADLIDAKALLDALSEGR